MTWNYRIMKRTTKNETQEYSEYAIFEIYYDNNNNVKGWTEDPVSEWYDSPNDLIKSLKMMLEDVKRHKNDILEYE